MLAISEANKQTNVNTTDDTYQREVEKQRKREELRRKREEREREAQAKEERKEQERIAMHDCRNYRVTQKGHFKRTDKSPTFVTKQEDAMRAVLNGVRSNDPHCIALAEQYRAHYARKMAATTTT